MELNPEERLWIKRKWSKIRRSQQKADTAGNEWNRLNDEINDYMDRSYITDIVQRTNIKRKSIPLKDALAMGDWHSAEAQRHIADVQLFLRLKELDIL